MAASLSRSVAESYRRRRGVDSAPRTPRAGESRFPKRGGCSAGDESETSARSDNPNFAGCSREIIAPRLPCARNWPRVRPRFTRGRDTGTPKSQDPPRKAGLHVRRGPRANPRYRAPSLPRLLSVLDQKADLAVDAKHRDLIVLDHDLGILDPKRTDAAQGLRCFANGLAAGVVEPVRRLRDDLDTPHDRHRPFLPYTAFCRVKHGRQET